MPQGGSSRKENCHIRDRLRLSGVEVSPQEEVLEFFNGNAIESASADAAE